MNLNFSIGICDSSDCIITILPLASKDLPSFIQRTLSYLWPSIGLFGFAFCILTYVRGSFKGLKIMPLPLSVIEDIHSSGIPSGRLNILSSAGTFLPLRREAMPERNNRNRIGSATFPPSLIITSADVMVIISSKAISDSFSTICDSCLMNLMFKPIGGASFSTVEDCAMRFCRRSFTQSIHGCLGGLIGSAQQRQL